MTNSTVKRLWLIYGILTALALVAAGVCLGYGCLQIYRSGVFTPQAVAEQFSAIAIVIYMALGMILCGLILHIFLPAAEKKSGAADPAAALRRLQARYDLDAASPENCAARAKFARRRHIHLVITAVLCILFGRIFLAYATNPENFHQSKINLSVILAVIYMGLCLVLPFGYGLLTAYLSRRSYRKELALAKEAVAAGCPKKEDAPAKKKFPWLLLVRLGLLTLLLSVALYGFFTGGTLDVLTKAINICTECVGLG